MLQTKIRNKDIYLKVIKNGGGEMKDIFMFFNQRIGSINKLLHFIKGLNISDPRT